MKRNATAVWLGSGKEGKGTFQTQSGAIKDKPYSYKTRFEDEPGTNPEELIAAAHAGCFSMKLSFVLGTSEITPEKIETTCSISLENGIITTSHLDVTVTASGLDNEKFQKLANEAKDTCPVSKLLNCNITLEARLT